MTTKIVASQHPLAQQASNFAGKRLPDNVSSITSALESLGLPLDSNTVNQIKVVVSTVVYNEGRSAFIAGFRARARMDGNSISEPVVVGEADAFISTLNYFFKNGQIYLSANNQSTPDNNSVCVGWLDDDGNANLYPVVTMDQLCAFNHALSDTTPNAIYRELIGMGLVIEGRNTSTKVKYSPECKPARVLVLKPEALTIGH